MALVIPHPRTLKEHSIEVALAVLISVAALGTSWSAYQAALWNGVQTTHYGLSSAYRMAGTRASLRGATTQVWEIGLLSAWLEAKEAGKERLAGFYASRFPPEFKPAFEEWLAQQPLTNPQAAPSPFRLPSYREPALAEAEAMDRKATAEFQAGQDANANDSAFMRGTAILAMAMFFGGIAQVFRGRRVRIGLAVVALLACLWGFERILSLPWLTLSGTS